MSKLYQKLNNAHCEFIKAQHIFFTATAPTTDGRVNLSPKGMNTLRIINQQCVGYLDLTGSGNETSAHIQDNGRMTIMLCSFSQQPLILRLYGEGEVITRQHNQWEDNIKQFDLLPGTRQIILLHIESVQTSCGFSIPYYQYQGERDTLLEWANKKGEHGIRQYWQDKNETSIDGLPSYSLTK